MAKQNIVVIDYGSGNLRSASKALEQALSNEGLSGDVKISNKPSDVIKADRIILPGQGAFGDCMAGLSALEGMNEALHEAVIQKGTPFLGICVGMQLMATRGLEHGIHAGLNWIPGEVVPFSEAILLDTDEIHGEALDDPPLMLKIPHMGWNELVLPLSGEQDNLPYILRSVKNEDGALEHYYFVHSFVFKCDNHHHVLAMCDYGGLFASIVGRDNMLGVQFHPEKSQSAGLKLLGDFLSWSP